MTRTFIKSALIGTVSFGVIAYCLVLVLAVLSQSGRVADVGLRLGPLEIFQVWVDESGHHFTIGTGIALVAALGGVVNGIGAVILARQRIRSMRAAH
ncbi:MAG: hypothetical protein FJ314_02840 [SAR202 cluster bacterium]|nr:hypothetical protein [SAR202 cluster bacterium]